MKIWSRQISVPDCHDELLLAVSLLIIWGAGVYYLYTLNWTGLILSLVLAIGSFIFLRPRLRPEAAVPEKNNWKIKWPEGLWLLAYLLLYATMGLLLFAARSDRALVSPWETVPDAFFWSYGLASALLAFILIRKGLSSVWKLVLLSAHYLLSFGVALVVYEIGYGFDPFIHQATMELIAAKGTVLPKPPYYLGEYGLVVTLAKLSGLSVAFLNKLLVPTLAAIFLPYSFYRFLGVDQDSGRSSQWLTILFLLALTFSPLIVTTPQNLSYLFLILTVLGSFGRFSLRATLLLALATTAIHPLTGLPALAWCAFLAFQKYRKRLSRRAAQIGGSLIFLFAALALPLALILAADAHFDWGRFVSQLSLRDLFTGFASAGRETWLINFVYFFANNYLVILLVLIGLAVVYAYREKRQMAGLLLMEAALLLSYLLSRGLEFGSLIAYEQHGYASRIPVIMFIFSLPFLAIGLRDLIKKIRREIPGRQIIWLIFGAGLVTASLYISYPRFDKYHNSRGYSTGASDLKAVRSVEEDAAAPYIVLANQQVSAAALKEFGFDHYYQTPSGPLYFYPIPTGGALYGYYLDMVYGDPSRAAMQEALKLVGADLGYLVVNKYWYQSGQVINAAKLSADEWWDVGGEVYIFKYQF